jgi:hypothetical protein
MMTTHDDRSQITIFFHFHHLLSVPIILRCDLTIIHPVEVGIKENHADPIFSKAIPLAFIQMWKVIEKDFESDTIVPEIFMVTQQRKDWNFFPVQTCGVPIESRPIRLRVSLINQITENDERTGIFSNDRLKDLDAFILILFSKKFPETCSLRIADKYD